MTYHQSFDRLGNPVARRSRQPIGHRIIQVVSVICSLILLAMLYGVRP
jgi:hypothetical protein